jgi:uncharacterized membrane protein YciS (DUF1049 family)
MKIVFRLVLALVIIAVTWVLFQNVNYTVDAELFSNTYYDAPLPIVILSAFTIGLVVGALLISLIALRYKADLIKNNRKINALMNELDSLRNLSIDEVAVDEVEEDEIKAVQIPIFDKQKTPSSENE